MATAARGNGGPGGPRKRAPGRRRLEPDERRRLVIDAAMEVFAEQGFHRTTMEEIAARASVTKPTLYAHFDSKEGLYQACVGRATDVLEAALGAAAAAGTPEQRMWAGCVALFDFAEEFRQQWTVLYGDPATAGTFAPAMAQVRARLATLMGGLFGEAAREKGLGEGALAQMDAIAHAFVAAAEALIVRWQAHPEEPKELQAVRLMNFAWLGLGDLIEGELWLPPE